MEWTFVCVGKKKVSTRRWFDAVSLATLGGRRQDGVHGAGAAVDTPSSLEIARRRCLTGV
jgi:hypothetical protein